MFLIPLARFLSITLTLAKKYSEVLVSVKSLARPTVQFSGKCLIDTV